MEDAHRAFVEGLEVQLVEMGHKNNVIAVLARLKAERPEKYHERLQVEGRLATVNIGVAVPLDEAQAFLRRMLGEATPETILAIATAKAPELAEVAP
jgi:hypothetical protein